MFQNYFPSKKWHHSNPGPALDMWNQPARGITGHSITKMYKSGGKKKTPLELAKDMRKFVFLAYSSTCKVFQDKQGRNQFVYTQMHLDLQIKIRGEKKQQSFQEAVDLLRELDPFPFSLSSELHRKATGAEKDASWLLWAETAQLGAWSWESTSQYLEMFLCNFYSNQLIW